MRIISVLPSATEIVFALGAGDSLVGRSSECDYPTTARSLPVVMAPRTLDSDRPASEIDERVRTARSNLESLYELDVNKMAALRPDVILTQDLCRVCSVTDEEVRTACAVAEVSPRIVSVSPTRLEEVWESIMTIGSAIDRREESIQLARLLRNRCREARRVETSPRVAVLEWPDPPIEAGLWAPDMIRAAGGAPIGSRPGRPGSRTSWPEVLVTRPDLVVVSPCSFGVERTFRELAAPEIASAIADTAPPLGFWVADEAYFSRPGPRLADGVDLLGALIGSKVPDSGFAVARWPGNRAPVAA